MTRDVCVLGLGYVGLPTAAMLASRGHRVYGYDVNPIVVETLRRGEIHIEEPGLLALVRGAMEKGGLVPVDALRPADAWFICVPTPFHEETKNADLSFVESAAASIVPHLKKGDLVVLESTVPPGTTEDVLVPILEKSGLSCERDLLVAHCPETVLPGATLREMSRNARVVGGYTREAADIARVIYESYVEGPIETTTAKAAELVKLVQNAYRDVNVAFANEIATIAWKLGVDARETIRLANKHPRVNVHSPGPGVGGHCIPVDPWFLVQVDPGARLLRAARAVNDGMPAHVARLVAEAVRGVEAPRVALLGLAYKADVDDPRESPSFAIHDLLRREIPGCSVSAVDPLVRRSPLPTVPIEEAARGADCLLLATDHSAFRKIDPEDVGKRMRRRIAVDTRGALDAAAWERAGFRVITH